MMTKDKLKEFRTIKGKKMTLNLHRGQYRAHESKSRFVAMLAGTQGGKTCYGVHWLEREIRQKGPGDYLAITATFPLLNLKMLPEFLLVFESLLHYGEYNRAEKIFVFHQEKKKKNDMILFPDADKPTRIIFGSATNPESIESATAKAAWLDEAGQKQFKRDAWEAILRRLSLAQGRVLFSTTLYTLGWFKSEIYDEWLNGNKDIDIIQFDSTENPQFPRKEYERAKLSLPNWKFKMFYQGQFDKPAGLIYDSFNPEVCKIPRFDIDQSWPRYVGHDFGSVNTAALWFAQDPGTGNLYAYREYLEGGRGAPEHAEMWLKKSKNERIIKRVGGAPSEDGWRQAFGHTGWPITQPTVKEVEVGISRVYAQHKADRIFVFNDMQYYLDEKLSYSRELDDNYNPTDKIADKSRFHLMDCERGIISSFLPDVPYGRDTKTDKIPVRIF